MENAMSKLSRRSLVTTAAALPALAVPAVSAIASPADDQLVALAGEAIKLNNEFELAHVTGAAWDAIVAIGDQLVNTLNAVKRIRAQSLRGLVAKARLPTVNTERMATRTARVPTTRGWWSTIFSRWEERGHEA
jgi:hypothetical protein